MRAKKPSIRRVRFVLGCALMVPVSISMPAPSSAQSVDLSGVVTVRQDDGRLKPANVIVVLIPGNDAAKGRNVHTDENGGYRFSGVPSDENYVLLVLIRDKDDQLVILKRLTNVRPRPGAQLDLTIEFEDFRSATTTPVPAEPDHGPLRALGKIKAKINSGSRAPRLQVQLGHSGPVSALAVSRGDRFVLSTCNDDGVVLWDVATGLELRRFAAGSTWVYDAALSPDNSFVMTGSREGAYLWDALSGELIGRLGDKPGEVRSVKFSPDGKYLLTGGSDHLAHLWELSSGRELKTFTGHTSTINCVAFSPDGRSIMTGSGTRADGSSTTDPSSDNTARLWEVNTGQERKRLTHSRAVTAVLFSPFGGMVASSSDDSTTVVWRIDTGAKVTSFKGEMAVGDIPLPSTLSWSADGNHILVYGQVWEPTKKRWSGPVSFSGIFTPDGDHVVLGNSEGQVSFYDTQTGRLVKQLGGNSVRYQDVVISRDDRRLLAGGKDGKAHLWDLVAGREISTFTGHTTGVNRVDLSLDGRWAMTGGGRWGKDNTARIWEIETGRELKQLDASTGAAFGLSATEFSADGSRALTGADDGTVRIWDTQSGTEIRRFDLKSSAYDAKFSADGKYLLTASGNTWAAIKPHTTIWELGTGREVRTFEGQGSKAALSRDNRLLVTGDGSFGPGDLILWNAQTGEEIRRFTGHAGNLGIESLAFSADGRFILSGGVDKTVRLWETATGRQVYLFNHDDTVRAAIFTSDGHYAVTTSSDGTTRFWSLDNGREICRLISFTSGGWIVVGPNGRFDTNDLQEAAGLHWIMPDDPMKPLPLEIFMRDYYEPQLLPRLLKCTKGNTCEREFKPGRDISALNRVQPPVKIVNVSLPDADGYVNVTLEAGKGEGRYIVNGSESTRTTGVYDLRLFRDGQIVGSWPNDGAEKQLQSASSDLEANGSPKGDNRSAEESRPWREATEIKPEGGVKIDQKTGMMALPQFRVKLPRGKDLSQIEFSAYAFNEDRVKSQTAKWEWPSAMIANLPKAQSVKPRAYIVSVGVNAYENADFDLEFAADDARRMAQVITEKLNATEQYQNVVSVSLISDHQTRDGKRVATETQASKNNFHAVLGLLAGKPVDQRLLAGLKNADQLRKATPDDFVLIMFSSHGYADRAGNFYFIPYDTGVGRGKVFTESVRRHSISSEELSQWLRDVDAGEMIMIVDACHSAAAIEGSDFKPGPMGSRGLGQLSYDKGMRILTATQSDNVALENYQIRQGLLTYALVHDGIEARQADFKPKDNVITLSEWLAYGVERVPKLYEEVRAGKVQDFGLATGPPAKFTVAPAAGTNASKALEEVLVQAKTQQPSLFDFTRKRREVTLVKTR